MDLATANYNSNNISVLMGSISGTFSAAVNYNVGTTPVAIISNDFNNDGKADLAVANVNSNNVSILLNSGTGSFLSAVNYTSSLKPNALTSGDFNGDGKSDIAVCNNNSSNISILMGSVAGTFSPAVYYAVGTSPFAVVSDDFNGDGKLDLAVTNGITANISVLIGSVTGTFSAAVNYTCGATPVALVNGDFNMDGIVDLAVTNSTGTGSITVLTGSGTGAFAAQVSYSASANPNSMVRGDFNNDGKPDLVAGNYNSNSIVVLLNGVPTVSTTSTNTVCRGDAVVISAFGANTYSWSSGSTTSSVSVSPTITTTYSVVGTTTAGCANFAVKTITVNALPIISVNSGSICAGQSFTMIPSGADTYTYSNGIDVVTPSTNDSYTVTGTDGNGCENMAVSNVTVNPLPVIFSNPGSLNACGDISATFGVASAGTNTYQWYFEYTQLPNDSGLIDGSYTEINFNTDTMTIQQVLTGNYNDYYVYCEVTNQFGCSSYSANDTIWANSTPTITVNSGTICAGQSFTLVPSGGDTYTYSSGTDVVMPIADATYTVNGTETLTGCSNYAVSSITVNALPTLMTMTTNTLLCAGETATLTVSGTATSYTWNTTENTMDIAVSPTVQTTYTVNGTDGNGCSNTTTITQDVSLCTGIVTLTNNNESINLYPNPNNGLFTVELPSTSKVTVTNALGQVVIAEIVEAGKHNLDIHNEAPGVYFVKVIENNKQQTIKVIKQ